MSEILSNSEVVKGQNPIPPQVEGIGNGLPNINTRTSGNQGG